MKLDMHCHTHEGSPDSEVPIKEYIELLKEQGYDGMLVTDHDSYEGYRYYVNHIAGADGTNYVNQNTDGGTNNGNYVNQSAGGKTEDENYVNQSDNTSHPFYVFKGVEYDTLEAGHFIVIMPDNVDLEILEYRGLPVRKLTEIVHANGGILGPAHPCGEPFLSIFATGRFKKDRSILKEFDFIEGFNCGEDPWANDEAVALAKEYNKPVTGGSDAHWHKCIGLAYTIIDEEVHDNDELIAYLKANKPTHIWGKPYNGTLKARLGKWNKLLVYGFFPYNKFGALSFALRRRKALRAMAERRIIMQASEEDTEEILQLYKSQLGREFCPWDEHYPGRDEIKYDLSRDSLFVMKQGGRIIAAITIDEDENVENLPCWSSERQPGAELSRLAVAVDCQNQGIARLMIIHAMGVLKERGCKSTHFLVNKYNVKALRSYEKLGLDRVGETFMYDQPFVCYEKEIE